MKTRRPLTEYGIWLKTELIKRQMTQQQLAEMIHVNKRVISDIMVGVNNKIEHRHNIKLIFEGADKKGA